ncbi:MAG: hypothetical protein DRN57_00905 [Thermoplasmata archaeon]|nr:MAG: hypothetical protein DRN57_00905 [Thermoplasmata archaeon]
MTFGRNLRVVISCVTFDTVKIVKPALHFRADMIYLIHQADSQPYSDFLKEVIDELESGGIEHKEVHTNINKFEDVMRTLVRIMEKETEKGNILYVNIEAGSAIYSSASLIASMMFNATSFNVGTKEHMIKDYTLYYENGRPMGLARDVYDPFILPEFRLERPRSELVKALAIWKDVRTRFGRRKLKETMIRLEEEGLLENVSEDGKVTHSGQMAFRRKFLLKWIEKGWMAKNENGDLEITPYGEMVLKMFAE